MFLYYNPALKERAGYLRKNATKAEIILWKYLCRDQLGYDFHRQKPIGNYIVDFFCSELNLVIEIDGPSHGEKINYDLQRQKFLESADLRILRFTETQVQKDVRAVLTVLTNWIEENTSLNPSSRREKR